MSDPTSAEAKLQGLIDFNYDLNPEQALLDWEARGWTEDPGAQSDDAPLKYMALVFSWALRRGAVRITMDKDSSPNIIGDTSFEVPRAPSSYMARGLEILREAAGMEGPASKGSIFIEVKGRRVEVILQKDAGRHTITMPESALLH